MISNSDAHHPSHIGREANIFDCPMDYKDITTALVKGDRTRFLGTVEAFPEEDRFYGSGHRGCAAGPARNGQAGQPCPSCGKPLAAGVAGRIESLADRPVPPPSTEPFFRTVPLQDVIAEALGFQPEAETVQKQYLQIVSQVGPELDILLNWPEDRLRERLPLRVAEGVLALRRGDVAVEPGYDGLPGRVRVRLPEGIPRDPGQLKLF